MSEDEAYLAAFCWTNFARSVGILIAGIWYISTPILKENPINEDQLLTSFLYGGIVWLTFAIIRRIIPDLFYRNAWGGCSLIIIPASLYYVKWPLLLISCIASIIIGHPIIQTIFFYGTLFIYDFMALFMSVFFRRE